MKKDNMDRVKICKENNLQPESLKNFVIYFLENFKPSYKRESFEKNFKQKIFDVSNAPEKQMLNMTEGYVPGHRPYSYLFLQNDDSAGIIDLDFIFENFANFRIQLLSAKLKIIKTEYQELLRLLTNEYGAGTENKEFNCLSWEDKSNRVIAIRKKIGFWGKKFVSFTITDKKYN